MIRYRPERADELIGLEIAAERAGRLLERLGFEVSATASVVAPTWRARDVTREIDLVEEVARFRLDEVPFTLPAAARDVRRAHAASSGCAASSRTCSSALGLSETYTPSLARRRPRPERVAAARADVGRARRPADARCCRASSRPPGATSTPATSGIALFEIARVYLPATASCPRSACTSAAIVEGGFARAKGVVETLYAALKVEPRFERAERRRCSTRARRRASSAGVVGELHPALLEGEWGVFELDLATLLAQAPRAGARTRT